MTQIGVQVCRYCFLPFGPRMIPIETNSKEYGNAQFWLHPDCFRAAFRDAKGFFADAEIDDMSVNLADR